MQRSRGSKTEIRYRSHPGLAMFERNLGSGDLLESLRLCGAKNAGHDVIPCHRIPTHLLGQLMATINELFEFLGCPREPLKQLGGNFRGEVVFDFIALRLADRNHLLRTQRLVRQFRVIRNNNIRRRFPAGSLVDKTSASAALTENTDAAKADWLHLRNS